MLGGLLFCFFYFMRKLRVKSHICPRCSLRHKLIPQPNSNLAYSKRISSSDLRAKLTHNIFFFEKNFNFHFSIQVIKTLHR